MDSITVNIIISLCIGIVTGIVAGVIVTHYYRRKDNEREKIKYFLEVRELLPKVISSIMPLLLGYRDNINVEVVSRQITSVHVPTRFDWYNISDDEDEYLKCILEASTKMLDCAEFIVYCTRKIESNPESHPSNKIYIEECDKAFENLNQEFDKINKEVHNKDLYNQLDNLINRSNVKHKK